MSSIEANYIQLQRDFGKLQRAHLELYTEHARLLAVVASADGAGTSSDRGEEGLAAAQTG